MFADEMICDKKIRRILGDGHRTLANQVLAATKFVLTPDFVSAADAVCDDREQLSKVTPFCRLPFSSCWIEFSNSARRAWLSRANVNTGSLTQIPQASIGTIGLLVRQIGDLWEIALFWKGNGYPISFTPVSVRISPSNVADILTALQDNNWIPVRHGIHPWGQVAVQSSATLMGSKFRDVYNSWHSDWYGEVPFFLAVIGLLNSRNIVDQEWIDKTDLNRKRARLGRPSFSSHYLLKISPRVRRYLVGQNAGGVEADAVRAHFVRGHFKIRKTGIFYWSPFMRGDLDRGYVAKDYHVAGLAKEIP